MWVNINQFSAIAIYILTLENYIVVIMKKI